MSQLPPCPKCQQVDQIRSIHVIVAEEPPTALSRMLAPPVHPQIEAVGVWSRYGGIIFIVGGVCSILTGVATIWPALSGGAVDSQMVQLGLSMVFGLGIIGAGWASLRKNAKKTKTEQAQFKVATTRWEAVHDRWARLFYCERDQGIFDPMENKLVEPSEMLSYLEG